MKSWKQKDPPDPRNDLVNQYKRWLKQKASDVEDVYRSKYGDDSKYDGELPRIS